MRAWKEAEKSVYQVSPWIYYGSLVESFGFLLGLANRLVVWADKAPSAAGRPR